MLCPSCSAEHSPGPCRQPFVISASAPEFATQDPELDPLDLEDLEMADSQTEARPASRLIEFPGVTRRSMPQWRKELSERVREVQERKAREAALELALETDDAVTQEVATSPLSTPQLELLPQAEAPEINPVLAAALRRIERAHQSATRGSNAYSRTATAMAIAPDREADADLTAEISPMMDLAPDNEPQPNPERTHSLVVVQAPIIERAADQAETEFEPQLDVSRREPEPAVNKPRPKRLIADDLNDPALSYLDNIGLASGPVQVEDRARLSTRFVAAILDVITVGFLSLPFAALIELQDGNWHQARIMGLMGGILAVLMFFYATVATALTGRTLGMRLLSLKAVDARNGLIPTGSQSAGRALVYLLSLATLGFGLLMAFARGEGKTAHDRLTRTAVVRA